MWTSFSFWRGAVDGKEALRISEANSCSFFPCCEARLLSLRWSAELIFSVAVGNSDDMRFI
jgi:hypothetical protein